jgi:hypothetical protein
MKIIIFNTPDKIKEGLPNKALKEVVEGAFNLGYKRSKHNVPYLTGYISFDKKNKDFEVLEQKPNITKNIFLEIVNKDVANLALTLLTA